MGDIRPMVQDDGRKDGGCEVEDKGCKERDTRMRAICTRTARTTARRTVEAHLAASWSLGRSIGCVMCQHRMRCSPLTTCYVRSYVGGPEEGKVSGNVGVHLK